MLFKFKSKYNSFKKPLQLFIIQYSDKAGEINKFGEQWTQILKIDILQNQKDNFDCDYADDNQNFTGIMDSNPYNVSPSPERCNESRSAIVNFNKNAQQYDHIQEACTELDLLEQLSPEHNDILTKRNNNKVPLETKAKRKSNLLQNQLDIQEIVNVVECYWIPE